MKRIMTTVAALMAGAALLSIPAQSAAQVSFEGRVGSSIPTGELADEPTPNQTAGLSFALDGMVSLNDRTTAYAGVPRHQFNCDGCARDVSSTGLNGGLSAEPLSLTYVTIDMGLHLHPGG